MNYETILMIKPTISEDQAKVVFDDVKKLAKDFSAKVSKDDMWGKKKMAYEVKGMADAYYASFDMDIPSESLKKFTNKLNLSNDVFRFLVVKKGK